MGPNEALKKTEDAVGGEVVAFPVMMTTTEAELQNKMKEQMDIIQHDIEDLRAGITPHKVGKLMKHVEQFHELAVELIIAVTAHYIVITLVH